MSRKDCPPLVLLTTPQWSKRVDWRALCSGHNVASFVSSWHLSCSWELLVLFVPVDAYKILLKSKPLERAQFSRDLSY